MLIEIYVLVVFCFDMIGFVDVWCVLCEYMVLFDMLVDYFFDMVDVVFQCMLFVIGVWCVYGWCVDLVVLCDVVLLIVEGVCDVVIGVGQMYVVFELCSGLLIDECYCVDIDDCDYYGLFMGLCWYGNVYLVLQCVFVVVEVV